MTTNYNQLGKKFTLSTNPNILNHQTSWLMDVLNVWYDSDEDEETTLNMLEDLGIDTTGLDVYDWPGCKYELTSSSVFFHTDEVRAINNVSVIINTLINKF